MLTCHLASERKAMCSRLDHRDRPATHTRIVIQTRPRAVYRYPECAECAAVPERRNKDVQESIRKRA